MKTEFPLPDLEMEATRGFWRAAGREQLAIPRCEDCGTLNWYPREQCQNCGGSTMPWTAMRGTGTLFTFTVVNRALFGAYKSEAPIKRFGDYEHLEARGRDKRRKRDKPSED